MADYINPQYQDMEEPNDSSQYTMEMPKSLEGRVSSRSVLMNSLRAVVSATNEERRAKANGTKPAKVILFTAAGQLECEFVSRDSNDVLDQAFDTIYETNMDMIRSMEEDQVLLVVGSASYVVLKDVVLQSWSAPKQKFHYERMCLFVDDIIGYTIQA